MNCSILAEMRVVFPKKRKKGGGEFVPHFLPKKVL